MFQVIFRWVVLLITRRDPEVESVGEGAECDVVVSCVLFRIAIFHNHKMHFYLIALLIGKNLERERRRQGRTCLFRCNKKCKINTLANCKCLSKVLHYVRKYLQNTSVHLISINFTLFYHYNGFKSLILSHQISISNFFGTYLAYLEVSLYIVLTNKIVSYLRYRQAFANLFTLNLNLDTICFVIFKPKLYIFVLVNQSRCQLRAIFST